MRQYREAKDPFGLLTDYFNNKDTKRRTRNIANKIRF